MASAPIRRHPALQPVSKEHHTGLMLCFQVRKGVREGIDHARLSAYITWFAAEHLEPHFRFEENVLLPLIPADDPMNLRIISEHAALRTFFGRTEWNAGLLVSFADLLDQHIRFEERVWFNFLQEHCDGSVLQKVLELHDAAASCGVWSDPFWLEFKR